MVRILLTNDDGIDSVGLLKLTEALGSMADTEVYVFAPADQRSASSHCLTLGKDIRVERCHVPHALEAYRVYGTPADSAKMGILLLRDRGIDIDVVYSGINHGPNLGSDIMYSGTVSAAAEGALRNIPAVAVSVTSHQATHFEAAMKLACEALPAALANVNTQSIININTPDLPPDEIKGVRIATHGYITYSDHYFMRYEENDGLSVIYGQQGSMNTRNDWTDDADVFLDRQGYATVTSVKYDLFDKAGTDRLRDFFTL